MKDLKMPYTYIKNINIKALKYDTGPSLMFFNLVLSSTALIITLGVYFLKVSYIRPYTFFQYNLMVYIQVPQEVTVQLCICQDKKMLGNRQNLLENRNSFSL